MLLVIFLGYYALMGVGMYKLSIKNLNDKSFQSLQEYEKLVKAVIILMSAFWPASVTYTFLKNAIIPSKK